jgi:predicted metal-dependent hydrolase
VDLRREFAEFVEKLRIQIASTTKNTVNTRPKANSSFHLMPRRRVRRLATGLTGASRFTAVTGETVLRTRPALFMLRDPVLVTLAMWGM